MLQLLMATLLLLLLLLILLLLLPLLLWLPLLLCLHDARGRQSRHDRRGHDWYGSYIKGGAQSLC